MRIAVIGGNLLGCATTLDLALVQELDNETPSDSTTVFEVTILETQPRLGGNSLRSIALEDESRVEVGAYRTLPILPGTYLNDLVQTVNDERATISIFNKRISLPGSTIARRGHAGAATIHRPWSTGTNGSLVRSYAIWDWQNDQYPLRHSGWPLLDLLHRFLNNNIWRSITLAALIYSIEQLRTVVHGRINRATMLAQCIAFLVLTVLSPQRLVAMWQHNYSFWGTTAPLLIKYGITPAIVRGSTTGFVKHLSKMNTRNVATCSISVGTLVRRAELDSYLRSTAMDFVNQFKYDHEYVHRHIEPVLVQQSLGADINHVNALALQFSLLDSDPVNNDARDRLCTISPDNATLCAALVDAAKATMPVHVKLNTTVTAIIYNERTNEYDITFADGASESFEGVVLCTSPVEGGMTIDTPVGSSLSDMLGYERDKQAAQQSAEEEAAHRTTSQAGGDNITIQQPAVPPGACTHIAVIAGKPRSSFFRFADERRIPDTIDVLHAPKFCRFERVREISKDEGGVYAVLVAADFESSGLKEQMFEHNAKVLHFESVPSNPYSTTSLPRHAHIDNCMPYVVLGTHFINAKAFRSIAKHPEMDAIAAVNTASLFSRGIQWGTEEDKGVAPQSDEDGGTETVKVIGIPHEET
ncbi:hypothetical protein BWQ96_00571 [Gracilariopsis chorda]|uniref:Uncharacterized protein n=1 Tax=Gracilariopsis chorda TaxID=448386 RepID=A0A2V3J5V7_9FLOR|nr:hypothetical protein BWQ96_00571 [Gracilariopsis chorda]|eukprot:PXF49693.1 hypothetical protein BWQ96_00571 [Gracilariopsis chorda]